MRPLTWKLALPSERLHPFVFWLKRAAAAMLLVWCAASALNLANRVVRSYNRLPEADYWETIQHLDGYRRFPPVVLWEQHYEHRVVLPEIVFAFDWLFLKGREILPLVLTGLLDISVWLIFASLIFSGEKKRSISGWSTLFLTGVVLFWPGVAVVLAFPFSLQFVLSQFCATASFWALTRRNAAAAIALAVGASFSSANGLFVWPLLIAIALLLRMGRRTVLTILGTAFLTTVSFFAGYRSLGNFHPETIPLHFSKVLGYFLTYLGMPLGAAGPGLGLAAGTGSLALSALLAFLVWRNKLFQQPLVLVPFAVVLQTLVLACITACSRIPLDRPFAAAVVTPGRYVNFGAHYWAALIVLCLAVLRAAGRGYQWAGIASLSALIGASFFQAGPWIEDWMNQYAIYQSATLAIESGLSNETIAKGLNYADGTIVIRSIDELRKRHLALYSDLNPFPLGGSLANLKDYEEIPASNITSVRPIEGGYQIAGWYALAQSRRIAVVNTDGIVQGYGSRLSAGLPRDVPFPMGHEGSTFLAYAGPGFDPSSYRLLAVRWKR